jgi:hypothetical protein
MRNKGLAGLAMTDGGPLSFCIVAPKVALYLSLGVRQMFEDENKAFVGLLATI